MNKLTNRQRSFLRALAHSLKPVVTLGQAGLTPAVCNEIDLGLTHHELIKVRLNCSDRELRKKLSADICRQTASHWVQNIGHIAILYRPAKAPRIKLPAAF